MLKQLFFLMFFSTIVLSSCSSNANNLKGEWVESGYVHINSISVINNDKILIQEEDGQYTYTRLNNDEFVNQETINSRDGQILAKKTIKIINDNQIQIRETWRCGNRLERDDLHILTRFK